MHPHLLPGIYMEDLADIEDLEIIESTIGDVRDDERNIKDIFGTNIKCYHDYYGDQTLY